MYRIFIIEDDRTIANAVKNHLEKWGFEARCAENFKDIMTEFSDFSPHLVLMDIGLPFYNGFYYCSEIRKISKVPVVFLSSASDNMNIVMAMNMGGDDFIAKPFDLTVLMAKIQAILRRTYDFGSETNIITHKGAMLNVSDATLSFNGEKIDLPKNEYRSPSMYVWVLLQLPVHHVESDGNPSQRFHKITFHCTPVLNKL